MDDPSRNQPPPWGGDGNAPDSRPPDEAGWNAPGPDTPPPDEASEARPADHAGWNAPGPDTPPPDEASEARPVDHAGWNAPGSSTVPPDEASEAPPADQAVTEAPAPGWPWSAPSELPPWSSSPPAGQPEPDTPSVPPPDDRTVRDTRRPTEAPKWPEPWWRESAQPPRADPATRAERDAVVEAVTAVDDLRPPTGGPETPAPPERSGPDPLTASVREAPEFEDPERSRTPGVCPFFRSLDAQGRMVRPVEVPDPVNRCAAYGDAQPQSIRQQELVCLRAAHADCPRYLRGVAFAMEPVAQATAPTVVARGIPRATLAASLVLLLSAGLAFAFVFAQDGISVPGAGGSPTPGQTQAAVVPSPTASPAATGTPASTAAPTPTPAVPTPAATAVPTPAATPGPTRAPTPTPNLRFDGLTPCPDEPDCYIYVVQPGNNLYSIARYYGHTVDTIRRLNPWIRDPSTIRPGDRIRMPTPTR